MDAQIYDKIVDKLMQFRGRIPVDGDLSHDGAIVAAATLRDHIDNLLNAIDKYAELDALGWLE
tara:strand:+ start:92 stop:280 length:189 start_codon:yes stop_codon:yes gene_type:complete